jgi:myosin-crossreactive antigen
MSRATDTDGYIVRLARRLERHRQAIDDVIAKIRSSDHPNAAALAEALEEQCWFPAWPEHVVRHHLCEPERWEADDAGIRRKRQKRRRVVR